MPDTPKDGARELTRLLDELDELHEELRAGCRAVRAAIVARDNPAVLAAVKSLHGLMARRRTAERRTADQLRAWGWLAPAEPFSLARLERRAEIVSRPKLRQRVVQSLATATATQRDAALNRTLIERLSAWLQREAGILLEPFADSHGYGASGTPRTGSARPAVLDQKG